MKRILYLIVFIFLLIDCFGQSVIQRSNGATTPNDPRLMVSKNFFIPRYIDTNYANLDIGVDSCGAIIYTYTGNKFWIRTCSPKKWTEVAGSGGSYTPSTNIDITGIIIKTTDSLTLVSGGEPDYILRHRQVGLGFPVSTLKPVLSGNMAFDIMPMGTPGNYSDNGIAWMDVCDANVIGGAGAVTTARVGVSGSAVQLGMRSFGGASEKKVNIVMGTDSVMTFNTDRTIDVNTSDFSISKNTSGNNIQWLLNPNTGNSASLFIIGQDFGAEKFGFIRYENDGVTTSTYQNAKQLEFMANTGVTNGMVIGSTATSIPLKFVLAGVQRTRMNNDSVLWLSTSRQTDTTGYDVLVRDRTTGNQKMIYAGLVGGGSTLTNIGTGISIGVDATNNTKKVDGINSISADSTTTASTVTFKLVNDQTSPGNNYIYSVSPGGIKQWNKSFPVTMTAPTDGQYLRITISGTDTSFTNATISVSPGGGAHDLQINRNSAFYGSDSLEYYTGGLRNLGDYYAGGVKVASYYLTQSMVFGDAASLSNSGGGSNGFYNTFVGYHAGYSNTTGYGNTFVGRYAGGNATVTGTNNSAIGSGALFSLTSGTSNTAVGDNALFSNQSGNQNTAIGRTALNSNTGTGNVAIGFQSVYSNTSGGSNTGFGTNALYYNQTGSRNVAIGYTALQGASTNSFSNATAIGYAAGLGNTTGSAGIFVGDSAGYNNTTGIRNIVIGTNLTASSATANYEMNIGGLLKGIEMTATGTSNAGSLGVGTTPVSADRVSIDGHLSLVTAGNKIKIATGSNASAGTGTFSGGTVTISTTAVTASSLIFIQHTSCTNCGVAYIGTVTAATSFVVNSNNASDASTFNWWLIN